MDWYLVITSDMREGLGLTGNELLAYALIYGYSNGDAGCYFGGTARLAQILGVKERQARGILKNLVDRGLIKREYHNAVPCYMVVGNPLPPMAENCQRQNNAEQTAINCQTNGNKLPHIYNNNINIYKSLSNKEEPSKNFSSSSDSQTITPAAKHCAPRFQKPSIAEIQDYCTERKNFVNPQQFFDFYESNGWMVGKNKMKDWKACVRTWEQRSKTTTNNPQPRPTYQTPKKESVFDKNMRILKEYMESKKEKADEQ